jgi:hypothetical protein
VKVPLHKTRALVSQLKSCLKQTPTVVRFSLAGAARRYEPLVGELVFVACLDGSPQAEGPLITSLSKLGEVKLDLDRTKISVSVKNAPPISVWFCGKDCWGSNLLAATGSVDHFRELRDIIRASDNLLLNRWGLWTKDQRTRLPSKTERDLYQALKIPYHPPSIRDSVYLVPDVIESLKIKYVKSTDTIIHCDEEALVESSETGHHHIAASLAVARLQGKCKPLVYLTWQIDSADQVSRLPSLAEVDLLIAAIDNNPNSNPIKRLKAAIRSDIRVRAVRLSPGNG